MQGRFSLLQPPLLSQTPTWELNFFLLLLFLDYLTYWRRLLCHRPTKARLIFLIFPLNQGHVQSQRCGLISPPWALKEMYCLVLGNMGQKSISFWSLALDFGGHAFLQLLFDWWNNSKGGDAESALLDLDCNTAGSNKAGESLRISRWTHNRQRQIVIAPNRH